jgi:hypothetical protein
MRLLTKRDTAPGSVNASRLLESLETLSSEEHAEVWAEEASRRDAELTRDESASRSASDVFREARARLG